jgi:hypothetical protein
MAEMRVIGKCYQMPEMAHRRQDDHRFFRSVSQEYLVGPAGIVTPLWVSKDGASLRSFKKELTP